MVATRTWQTHQGENAPNKEDGNAAKQSSGLKPMMDVSLRFVS
jgi:hypothetical protein